MAVSSFRDMLYGACSLAAVCDPECVCFTCQWLMLSWEFVGWTAIVITSAKYHTPVEFSNLSEATMLGWTTASIPIISSYMLGYVAAPSYMFILPLAHLVSMNTSPYLASPGLTTYSVLSFVQTVWIANHDQVEQRNTFERQVPHTLLRDWIVIRYSSQVGAGSGDGN